MTAQRSRRCATSLRWFHRPISSILPEPHAGVRRRKRHRWRSQPGGPPAHRLPKSLPAPTNLLAIDAAAERIASDLSAARPVQFTAVRYPGIDAVGHYYLRYAMPRAFGDVSDEERIRYGRVLEQYYTYVDGMVGRAMAALRPGDLLLVVSGFGMEPLSLGKRLLERAAGDTELSGSHEGAPDGFLMAYGRSVARARSRARRWWMWRRPCSIFSGCRSRATWTATPAPTSSHPASPSSGRLRSFRTTTGRWVHLTTRNWKLETRRSVDAYSTGRRNVMEDHARRLRSGKPWAVKLWLLSNT